MAILTYMGATYDCATAIKGPDYIHLLDENGNMVAAFDGITSFSDFVLSGCEYTAPQNADNCKIVVMHEDGTMGPGPYSCKDVGDAAKRAEDVSKSVYANGKFYQVQNIIGPYGIPDRIYSGSNVSCNSKYIAVSNTSLSFYSRDTGECVYTPTTRQWSYPHILATDDKLFAFANTAGANSTYLYLYNPDTKTFVNKITAKAGSTTCSVRYAGYVGDKAYVCFFAGIGNGVASSVYDVKTLSRLEARTTVLPYGEYKNPDYIGDGYSTPSGMYAHCGYCYCLQAKYRSSDDKWYMCLRVYDLINNAYNDFDMPDVAGVTYTEFLWRDDDTHEVYFTFAKDLYKINYVTGAYSLLIKGNNYTRYFGHLDEHTVCLRTANYYFHKVDLHTNTVLRIGTTVGKDTEISSAMNWDRPKLYQKAAVIFPIGENGCFKSYCVDKETMEPRALEYVDATTSLTDVLTPAVAYTTLANNGDIIFSVSSDRAATNSTSYHYKHWIGDSENGYGLGYTLGFVREVLDVRG